MTGQGMRQPARDHDGSYTAIYPFADLAAHNILL
jgi:hypothetical protein